jgi:hypothetical protein
MEAFGGLRHPAPHPLAPTWQLFLYYNAGAIDWYTSDIREAQSRDSTYPTLMTWAIMSIICDPAMWFEYVDKCTINIENLKKLCHIVLTIKSKDVVYYYFRKH